MRKNTHRRRCNFDSVMSIIKRSVPITNESLHIMENFVKSILNTKKAIKQLGMPVEEKRKLLEESVHVCDAIIEKLMGQDKTIPPNLQDKANSILIKIYETMSRCLSESPLMTSRVINLEKYEEILHKVQLNQLAKETEMPLVPLTVEGINKMERLVDSVLNIMAMQRLGLGPGQETTILRLKLDICSKIIEILMSKAAPPDHEQHQEEFLKKTCGKALAFKGTQFALDGHDFTRYEEILNTLENCTLSDLRGNHTAKNHMNTVLSAAASLSVSLAQDTAGVIQAFTGDAKQGASLQCSFFGHSPDPNDESDEKSETNSVESEMSSTLG